MLPRHGGVAGPISLAKSPGSLVRFAFHEDGGAHGGSCTRTVRGLSPVPLLLGYVGNEEELLQAGLAPALSRV